MPGRACFAGRTEWRLHHMAVNVSGIRPSRGRFAYHGIVTASEIFLFSSIVLSIEKGLWHVPLNARRYRPDSPVQDFERYCKPSRCLSAPRCSSSGRKPPLHPRRRLSIERIDALLDPADHSCRASIRSRTAGQVVALYGLSSVAMFFRAIDTIDMSIVCPATFCVQQSHINAQLHSIRPVTA
jgi:hypothetical protein